MSFTLCIYGWIFIFLEWLNLDNLHKMTVAQNFDLFDHLTSGVNNLEDLGRKRSKTAHGPWKRCVDPLVLKHLIWGQKEWGETPIIITTDGVNPISIYIVKIIGCRYVMKVTWLINYHRRSIEFLRKM